MIDPRKWTATYLRLYRYYEYPKEVEVDGKKISVKWQGAINQYFAMNNSSSLNVGLYYLAGTGSFFGYYDGQVLYHELMNYGGNHTFKVQEQKGFGIFDAYRNNRIIIEPKD